MGKFSLYAIPLLESSHKTEEFEYKLDDKFFKLIEDTVDIRKGDLIAKVTLKHVAREYELLFDISGTVKVQCDRCLDDLELSVSTKNRLVVKFGQDYSEESDEIVIIPESEQSINIAWFMFEFVTLSLPMKHVHPAGQCNKAMSAKYNKHKAEIVTDDEDDSEDINEDFEDPRWDALKDLSFEGSEE